MEIAASVVSTIFKYYCIRTYMDTALKRKQNVPDIRRGLVFFTAFFPSSCSSKPGYNRKLSFAVVFELALCMV